jgi:hypothetical protein
MTLALRKRREAPRLPRREGPMTVCIAAVCNILPDLRPAIITASDRMITIGEIQYEPDQTKTVDLAAQTVGLFAGDMQLHAGIIVRVKERIREALHDNPTNINVADIARIYGEEFAYYRRSKAEREILMPRGLDFDRFLSRQATMAHYQVRDIDAALAAYYIDSTAIIAGIDPSGPHIFKVTNPGIVECLDTPYFACAGSGEWLANTQFMLARYDKTFPFTKALWLTFAAKARAEIAGGVGERTDLVIVSALPSTIYRVPAEQMAKLYDLFRRTEEKERAARGEAENELEEYVRSLAQNTATSSDQRQTAPPTAPSESDADAKAADTKPLLE